MKNKTKQGFIGLVTVITVSAVAVLITSATLLRSITEITVSADEEQSAKAWAAAGGCVEYALTKYASTTGHWGESGDYNPSGGDELSIGENTCYIVGVDGANSSTSSPRTIKAESIVSTPRGDRIDKYTKSSDRFVDLGC
jgi:hypothetical protein